MQVIIFRWKIFGFFKKILDIDVKGLIRDFVPDQFEKFFGLEPTEEEKVIESKEQLTEEQLKEQKRAEVQTKIQEAKDRIARSESGENVYGSSFNNALGLESVGQKQDRKLVEQLPSTGKKYQDSQRVVAVDELPPTQLIGTE